MDLDLTPEQQQFQKELRDYFAKMMTPELVQEMRTGGEGGGPEYRKALQQMGSDGLLGVGWPTEYGGLGRPPIDRAVGVLHSAGTRWSRNHGLLLSQEAFKP